MSTVRVPPGNPKRRKRFYALLAKARTAPLHQRRMLRMIAHGLMQRVLAHERSREEAACATKRKKPQLRLTARLRLR